MKIGPLFFIKMESQNLKKQFFFLIGGGKAGNSRKKFLMWTNLTYILLMIPTG